MSEEEPRSVRWLRRVTGIWGFALFILFVMIAFRAVIIPFVFGILVAYIFAPVVDGLSSVMVGSRPIPRWVSVIAVYLGVAAAIALFLTSFLPHLSGDFARLFREAPGFFKKVKNEYIPAADEWIEQAFPQDMPIDSDDKPSNKIVATPLSDGRLEINLEGIDLEIEPQGRGRFSIGPRSPDERRTTRLSDMMARAAQATESELKGVVQVGQRFVAGVFKSVAWFILTFMVAAYLLIDLKRVMSFLRSLAPEGHRDEYDQIAKSLDHGLSGVIRGQLIICVVNGILTTLGLLIFQVKYPLLLGLVAGAMSFIPVFGSILSSVPIVAVALMSGAEGINLSSALAVLGWIIGIHLFEANLFNPKIIGSAAKMHPVVVVFALMVGEESGGLTGAVLAVPVASMVQVLFLHFRNRERKVEALP